MILYLLDERRIVWYDERNMKKIGDERMRK